MRKKYTVQDQADYWAWQVEVGLGSSEARLRVEDFCSFCALKNLPKGTVIVLGVPEDEDRYENGKRVVYGVAKLIESDQPNQKE